MIAFDRGSQRFNYRVAGVCLLARHVLLHRAEAVDFWTMPGGRPELGEASRDALVRELREELGLEVRVGRLFYVVENFFEVAGCRYHELALYYEMMLPPDSAACDTQREFSGLEGNIPVIFRWFPLARLSGIRLYPTFLCESLQQPPSSPQHVVHIDPPN